jgi:hypothetical protein
VNPRPAEPAADDGVGLGELTSPMMGSTIASLVWSVPPLVVNWFVAGDQHHRGGRGVHGWNHAAFREAGGTAVA